MSLRPPVVPVRRPLLLALALACAAARAAVPAAAQGTRGDAPRRPMSPDAHRTLGRAVLQELVETNTTYTAGSTTKAAEALAARFRAAGFPATDVRVVGPDSGRDAKDGNLIVRYRGRGTRRPILLLGHLDVVEARREDWVRDPFTLVEDGGHLYGRGVLDMKASDAAWVAALLRLRQEGFAPAGDLVLVLTAGEEGGGGYNGIGWLLRQHPELREAQYAVNADLGPGEMRGGRASVLRVLVGEKLPVRVNLTATSAGGHSSLPVAENAIYRLAHALDRLERFAFPVRLTDANRAQVAGGAAREAGALAADLRAVSATSTDTGAVSRVWARSPYWNAILHTTCVSTMISGGHAPNALPQRATATVSCRILPGDEPADVRRTLHAVIADSTIVMTGAEDARHAPMVPAPPALLRTVESIAHAMWGPVAIETGIATFGTDGAALRTAGVPSFGVNGLFVDADDPADMRPHGLDERVGVKAFHDQLEFAYRLARAL